jgi:short-subunit dehydrogenase
MYSTTKYAVVGFTHQLRWELAAKGVGVTLVIPGLVKSPILERPEAGLSHMPTSLIMKFASSSEGLARKVRKAVQRDRAFITYGADAFMIHAARHLPHWLFNLLGRGLAMATLALVRGKETPLPAPAQPPRDVVPEPQQPRPD